MTHLYLVRHGATIWHAENRYAGTTDAQRLHHLRPEGNARHEMPIHHVKM